ncbi:MAG: SDR family NAD(P)-dependent oxidoreductase [Sphaerochaetaceae bacterium]
MKNKIVVITGTTSGVGKAASWRFAKGGAHIIMVCRNQGKAEALKQELQATYPIQVDIILADFSDLDQVRTAAQTIVHTFAHIDVLIHNIGIYLTKKTLIEEGVDKVFLVNHLASFLFNMLLLPTMKDSTGSRIIYVNSEGHRFCRGFIDDRRWQYHRYTGLKSYGAAKTAQLLTIWEFADHLKGSKTTINAMHPGAVKSQVGYENGGLYAWYARHILSHFLKDPAISGEALYYLATDEELKGISGKFFNQTVVEQPAPHAMNREYGKRIWEESLRLTGWEETL